MQEARRFGGTESRSFGGSLLCSEIEKIRSFLRFGGTLATNAMGGLILLRHPETAPVDGVLRPGQRASELLLAAGVEQLREHLDLRAAEIRTMESLSPGPLVLEVAGESDLWRRRVCVPDSIDLRDIASSLGGMVPARFLEEEGEGPSLVQSALDQSTEGSPATGVHAVGVLELHEHHNGLLGRPTVVRVLSPGSIECLSQGATSLEMVVQASKRLSEWEMGEWT